MNTLIECLKIVKMGNLKFVRVGDSLQGQKLALIMVVINGYHRGCGFVNEI